MIRFALDRTTVVILAAGLVMLQVLIFSAGFLMGAAGGVQALTPPEPPREEIRRASLPEPPSTPVPRPAPIAFRPSPLAKASFLVPVPPARHRVSPVRISTRLPRRAESYAALIRDTAERHSVSPALVEAIARVESAFNPRAVSHKGARGLMQVMPATGRRFGVRSDKLFDPEHNLNAGVAYLAWLSKRYRGDIDLIAAAYNAGEGAVDDHGGIPPYRETRDYVKRVQAALRSIEAREAPPLDAAGPAGEPTGAQDSAPLEPLSAGGH